MNYDGSASSSRPRHHARIGPRLFLAIRDSGESRRRSSDHEPAVARISHSSTTRPPAAIDRQRSIVAVLLLSTTGHLRCGLPLCAHGSERAASISGRGLVHVLEHDGARAPALLPCYRKRCHDALHAPRISASSSTMMHSAAHFRDHALAAASSGSYDCFLDDRSRLQRTVKARRRPPMQTRCSPTPRPCPGGTERARRAPPRHALISHKAVAALARRALHDRVAGVSARRSCRCRCEW